MLDALAGGSQKTLAVLRAQLRIAMAVSDDDFQEMLPSGVRTRFADRTYWANTHLYQAGLVRRPANGVLQITDRDASFRAKHQGKILVSDLMQFPEFAAFRRKSFAPSQDPKSTSPVEKTPQERIEEADAELRESLAKELLDRIAASSATAFERLVIQLLVKMGYGGGGDQRRPASRWLWRWRRGWRHQSGCFGSRSSLRAGKALEGFGRRRSHLRICG